MRCPVCEAENRDDASECSDCGKVLREADDRPVEATLIQGLESTQLEHDEAAPQQWTPGHLELERTALDDAPPPRRAPPPQEPGRSPPGETVTCPACFARVLKGARCSDCGLPFPVQEL